MAQRIAAALDDPQEQETAAKLAEWILQRPNVVKKLQARMQRPAQEVGGMQRGLEPHSCNGQHGRGQAGYYRSAPLPMLPHHHGAPHAAAPQCRHPAVQHPINTAFTWQLVGYLTCLSPSLARKFDDEGLLRDLELRFDELAVRCAPGGCAVSMPCRLRGGLGWQGKQWRVC